MLPCLRTGCRSVARCSSGPSRSARPHRHASLRRMPPFCCQEATAGCRRLRKMRFPHTTASLIHASTVSPDRSSFARSSHIAPRLRPRRPVPARGRGDRGGILPKDRKVAVSGWVSDPAWGSGQELAWGSGLELASDPGPFSIRNRPSCCRLNYPYCRNYCSNRLLVGIIGIVVLVRIVVLSGIIGIAGISGIAGSVIRSRIVGRCCRSYCDNLIEGDFRGRFVGQRLAFLLAVHVRDVVRLLDFAVLAFLPDSTSPGCRWDRRWFACRKAPLSCVFPRRASRGGRAGSFRRCLFRR